MHSDTQRFRLLTLAFLSFLCVAALTACGGGTASATTASSSATTASGGGGPANTASAPTTTPTGSTSSNAGPVTVVAHTLAVNAAGSGTSPMTTPAVTTPASGSLILVQVLTQGPGTLSGLSDNKGNHYVQIGQSQTYAGSAGSYLFACENAIGGTGQTWSLTKSSGYADNEASIYVVVLAGASTVGNWSYANTSANSGAPMTTTAANSIVVSFWGPSDYTGAVNTYTPPAGWTKGDSNRNSSNENTGADAWMTVPTNGTRINPTWSAATPITDPRSSMWLVEAKP